MNVVVAAGVSTTPSSAHQITNESFRYPRAKHAYTSLLLLDLEFWLTPIEMEMDVESGSSSLFSLFDERLLLSFSFGGMELVGVPEMP